MSEKILPLAEWAKKNKLSERQARRLAANGTIPIRQYPVYIYGVPSTYKYQSPYQNRKGAK